MVPYAVLDIFRFVFRIFVGVRKLQDVSLTGNPLELTSGVAFANLSIYRFKKMKVEVNASYKVKVNPLLNFSVHAKVDQVGIVNVPTEYSAIIS